MTTRFTRDRRSIAITQVYDEDGNVIGDDNPMQVIPGEQARDAFARTRISEPETLFDSKMLYDKAPLIFDESITNVSGNATSTWGNATVTMHAEAGDTIIRQSKMRMNYQPGKSQFAALTGVLPGGAGVTSRLGLFTAANGIFFERVTDVLKVVLRNNSVDTGVAKDNWNVDSFDGSGPSGVAVNFDKAQIYFIDFEWLGVGQVRFGLFLNGQPWVAHKITNVNALDLPYIDTPNQPVRYEVSVAGGGASADMKHICSTVASEGGVQANGLIRAFTTGSTPITALTAGTIYPLLGVRLKGTHLDATILAQSVNMIATTADDFEWLLLLNPTVSGTFTYGDEANSALQFVVGDGTQTIADGLWDVLLGGGFTKNAQQGASNVNATLENALRIGSLIDGTQDELVLAVRSLGASATMHATLTLRELV